MIQPLLTTVHSFLYVRIHLTRVKWNWFVAHITSSLHRSDQLHCIYVKCKLVFCLVLRRVNVGRIYSSIAKDLKFDWSIPDTWKLRELVNKICLSMFPGIAAGKLTNTPAVIFSCQYRSRWFIFAKQIIVLIWVIIYRYLQSFCKIDVLKTFYTIQRKTTMSEFFFN